jgi:two-component system LytT family response regulator
MFSQKIFSKIKAIIVDDEFFGRENLKKIIETYCPEIVILGSADSVVNAKEFVDIHKPDVVFLDINMPVLNGFDFLEEFDERNFMVVFVSAHEEFGIKAVKAGALDYILKPINIKELKQTVKKLVELKNKSHNEEIFFEPNKLIIPASHGITTVLIDDIVRLEADGCYTTIILDKHEKIVISKTLKEFEEKLPKERFYRTHKSHLINLKFFKEFSNLDGNYVVMSDGSKIELSRRKAPEFIQKIKTIMKSI